MYEKVNLGLTKNFGKSSPVLILLLLSFVLAGFAAFYFSAPDKSSITELLNTQQTVSEQTNDQAVNEFDNSSVNTASQKQQKKDSLFTRIFSSDKTSQVAPQKQAKAPVSMSDAEQAAWLAESYSDLHDNPGANGANAPSLAGRVLNKQGQPINNVSVTAVQRNYHQPDTLDTHTHSSTTNANGFFAFKDLVKGTYLLSTSSNKRYLPKHLEVSTGVKFADIVLTEMELIELQGQVVDATGQALSGVAITPITKGNPLTIKSDSEGQFKLDASIGARHNIQLRLDKKGFKQTRFSVDVEDYAVHNDLYIEMDTSSPVGRVSGVVLGLQNDYLSEYAVHLTSNSLHTSYHTKTDAAGQFEFDGVEAGDDYRLSVRPRQDYKDFHLDAFQVDANPVTKTLQLEALDQGYQLSGQILDRDQRPIPNARLILRSVDANNQRIPIIADENGAYQLNNVPAGALEIKSNSTPYFSLTGLTLDGENRSYVRDLVIDYGENKLLGKIVDEQGRPVSAPQIYLTSTQLIDGVKSQSSRKTSANEDGKFLFTDLGAAQYTITVNAPGFDGVRLQHRSGLSSPVVVRLTRNSI